MLKGFAKKDKKIYLNNSLYINFKVIQIFTGTLHYERLSFAFAQRKIILSDVAAHATSIAQALLLLSTASAGFMSTEFWEEDAAPSPFSDGGIFSESLASSQSILNLVTRG